MRDDRVIIETPFAVSTESTLFTEPLNSSSATNASTKSADHNVIESPTSAADKTIEPNTLVPNTGPYGMESNGNHNSLNALSFSSSDESTQEDIAKSSKVVRTTTLCLCFAIVMIVGCMCYTDIFHKFILRKYYGIA